MMIPKKRHQPKPIKTAKEHRATIIKFQSRAKKEQKQFMDAKKAEQERIENYEYLRDELMSAVKNSQMSFADIHGKCGPHPKTLERWSARETMYPQMRKMQATAWIIGLRAGWIARG